MGGAKLTGRRPVEVGGPLPWIVRVARNCAIDRLRARRVRATVDATAIDLAAIEAAAPATGIQLRMKILAIDRARDWVTMLLKGAVRVPGIPPIGTPGLRSAT